MAEQRLYVGGRAVGSAATGELPEIGAGALGACPGRLVLGRGALAIAEPPERRDHSVDVARRFA